MSFVTHEELDKAIEAVREDIGETEQRLRSEFTDAMRFEFNRTEKHLDQQDGKINWVLGLIVTLLITAVGSLLYVALAH